MLTFHVSMGVSVAQHVLESECNVETSDSAKMTKKSAAREQAVRPLLLLELWCMKWFGVVAIFSKPDVFRISF